MGEGVRPWVSLPSVIPLAEMAEMIEGPHFRLAKGNISILHAWSPHAGEDQN